MNRRTKLVSALAVAAVAVSPALLEATGPATVAAHAASVAAPTQLGVTITSDSTVVLTWSAGASPSAWTYGRDGYDSTGYGPWAGTIPGSARTAPLNDLVKGRDYTVFVTNRDTGETVRLVVNTAAQGFGLKATLTASGTVTVTWNPSANPAAGWAVSRDGVDLDGTGAWTNTLPGTASSSWFDKLRPGATYTFTLTNRSTGRSESVKVAVGTAPTSPAPTQTATPTPAPTGFSLKATLTASDKVTVTWNPSANPAAGWAVSRDGVDLDGTGAWTNTLPGTASSSWFDKLRPGATYTFTLTNRSTGRSESVKVTVGTAPTTPAPTPTNPGTTTGAFRVGQRSGLPFDLGVFAHSPERVVRFEQVVGRKVDVYQISPDRTSGFGGMLYETKRMLGYVPAGAKVDLSVPLMTQDEARQLGQALRESGHGDAYVRPGWEFNLGGMGWGWTVDQIGYDTYIRKFRENAAGFRAGSPEVKMEWNPNACTKGFNHAVRAWPGDAYVDVVGVDVYNWNYEDSWSCDGDLNDWLGFAKQHGKKMSLPEWGNHGGEDGRGDDPAYVTRMLDWIAANRETVVFASYFDENEAYIKNSIADGQMPRSGTAFREALRRM